MRILLLASAASAALAGAPASAQDGDVRFYGRESFTVVSALSGSHTGTVTEHVRDWGRLRVEIRDAEMSLMGMTQPDRNRIVYDQDQIITIDSATGATTVSQNPMYDNIVAAMGEEDGVSFGRRMLTGMGGQATGETGEFAGFACDYWTVPQMANATVCVTDEGLTLSVNVSMGPITTTQTAVEVRLDDGGPDEAFAYDADAATSLPNLNDIMNAMGGPN